MDSLQMNANEALGSPLLKSMASHATFVNEMLVNLATPLLLPPYETMHQLPKVINIEELQKSKN
jgi:hypothetical protein